MKNREGYATGLIDYSYKNYTNKDKEIWNILYNKALSNLKYIHPEFNFYREKLNISEALPNILTINKILSRETNFTIRFVEGLLESSEFFLYLSQRIFPVTYWIRSEDELGYLKEPDFFHDFYGHVPWLMNKNFADYVEIYGKNAVKNKFNQSNSDFLNKLYWFTVEFGLIKYNTSLKIYGAGLISSYLESPYSIISEIPKRYNFDINKISDKTYRIDQMQKEYFIIESFQDLFNQTKNYFSNFNHKN